MKNWHLIVALFITLVISGKLFAVVPVGTQPLADANRIQGKYVQKPISSSAGKALTYVNISGGRYRHVGFTLDSTFDGYSGTRVSKQVLVDWQDPTGFVDPNNIVATYDSTTRTLTLSHASGSIAYYWAGAKKALVSPWTSSAHTNSTGRYFLLSTDGNNFTWSTTAWEFYYLQLGLAVFNTSDKFGLRETHGMMPWSVHQEFHAQVGTYRVSGGTLTTGTYTENTATDAATTPGFDAAVIKDEDVSHSLAAWAEGTYTTMRIGASSVATFDVAASFPFRSSGSYILVNNPATGAETAASTLQYVNIYQILVPATTDTASAKYRMLMLQPQTTFSSLAAAQAEDFRGLSLGDFTTTAPEFVPYARITYVLSAANSNTGKCRIATGGVSYISYNRSTSTSGNSTPVPSAAATYIVQTADTTIPNAQTMGALGTGIVKNTTGTGVQSIAVAADFPTLNQNTTGSAATLTTPRTINGVAFDGSANIQTATANTSDYATGTFTPTVAFGGGTTGITYGTRVASYTQIGNRVFGNLTIPLTSKGSSTGAATINDLPLTASNVTLKYHTVSFRMDQAAATMTGFIQAYISPNTKTITLEKFAAGAATALTDADFNNNTFIIISFQYEI